MIIITDDDEKFIICRRLIDVDSLSWHHRQQHPLFCLFLTPFSLFLLVSKRQKLIDELFHRRPYYYLRCCQQAQHSSTQLPWAFTRSYPKPPKKKEREMLCMSKKAHAHRKRRGNGKTLWNICCQCFLSMCATAASIWESALDLLVWLCECKIFLFHRYKCRAAIRERRDLKHHNKSAPPHRQISLSLSHSPRLHIYFHLLLWIFFSLEHLIIFLLSSSRLFIHRFGIHSFSLCAHSSLLYTRITWGEVNFGSSFLLFAFLRFHESVRRS